MVGGGLGEPGPPFASGGQSGEGEDAPIDRGRVGGPCGTRAIGILCSAPREHFRSTPRWCCREWNFEEIEGYHWGTSRAGRDEGQENSGVVALDEWFKIEYDSRLSRKRDSEQEISCLTIESGIRMCEANSK